MRENKIMTVFTILKGKSEEEQKTALKNAVNNGYINNEEADEIFDRLEDEEVRGERVRAVCTIIENYTDEQKEEALNNAINNEYLTTKEVRQVWKLLKEKEESKFPYKAIIEKIKKENEKDPQYYRLAMEYILGEDNNYVLRGDLADEEKKRIAKIVRKISRKDYDGRERLIVLSLIPEFVTEERSKEDICMVCGVEYRDVAKIEDESR